MEGTQQQSGQPLNWILSELGLSRSVYYDWLGRRRKRTLADRVVIPRSPKAALPDEIEAVVDFAKAEPRERYRRLEKDAAGVCAIPKLFPHNNEGQDASLRIEMGNVGYNAIRPHQALGYLTPLEFLEQYQQEKRREVMCH